MPTIPPRALAKHWEVTQGRLRQLRMRDGSAKLPEFADLGQVPGADGVTMVDHPARFAEADAWRRVYAPPRKKSAAAVAAAGFADVPDASSAGKSGEGGAAKEAKVDVQRFLVASDDFDADVIRQSEDAVKVQWGLYLEACKEGNSARIASAFDNWQNAAKRCREIRDGFVKLRERAANVITVDRAADIVSRELGVLQALLDDFDVRIAPLANPDDPAVAKAAIRAGLVEVFERIEMAGTALIAEADESAA